MTSPKVSKLRWTTGTATKEEELPIAGSPAIWDCGNLIACNEDYVAFPSSSSGSVALMTHDQIKIRGFAPKKLFGQKGHVIDLAFNPFDPSLLMTASEDGTIRGWKIPQGGITADTEQSLTSLTGHARKVGLLAFHPSAQNVLASGGMDNVVNIWDITAEAPKGIFKEPCGDNQIMSLNWNLDGSLLNITGKDKMVHILDSRSGKVAASGKANEGSKTMRSLWAKRRNQIITFGFNKSQYRQMMLFDARSLDKPLFVKEVDQMSNIMMPFYDEDTNLLYVGGRGEAGIKYFEVWDEQPPIVALQAFSHGDPQKGLAMMPKTTMDVKDCQLAKFYKLTTNKLSTISFNLPRRQGATQFQSDIFPNTFAAKAAITAEDFFAGKNALPVEVSLAAKFEGGEIQTVATSGQLSSTSSPISSPTTNFASGAAASGSSPATPKPAVVTPVATKEPVVAVVAKDPVEELTEKVAAQQKVVESAKKALSEAESKLAELEQNLKAEQAKKNPPAAAAALDVAAVSEEKKEEEKVEEKTEATVAAVASEEEKKDE